MQILKQNRHKPQTRTSKAIWLTPHVSKAQTLQNPSNKNTRTSLKESSLLLSLEKCLIVELVCLFHLQRRKNTQKKNVLILPFRQIWTSSFSKAILCLLFQALSTIKRFSPVRPVFKHTMGDIWMFYTWNTNGSRQTADYNPFGGIKHWIKQKTSPIPYTSGRKCFKSQFFFAEVYFCAYGWPVSKALWLLSAAAKLKVGHKAGKQETSDKIYWPKHKRDQQRDKKKYNKKLETLPDTTCCW